MQDFNDLSGTALVIGGTGGIGSEICKLLAKRGSDIAFTYQNNLEKADHYHPNKRSGVNSLKHSLDLDDQDDVLNFIQSLGNDGGIHTLIYAAGPLSHKCIYPISTRKFSLNISIQKSTHFCCCYSFLPFIRKQMEPLSQSHLQLQINTYKGWFISSPKAAIEILIKGFAKEEGRYGVRKCSGPWNVNGWDGSNFDR
ncbi:MAG: hypothetical protein CM15mP49_35800 [Actinomycetota bacterium]|nr:MAG: hypothetical protein CM15mP49_35800 [Actinomycetota bacterium]